MVLDKHEFEQIYKEYVYLVRSIIFRSIGETYLDELTQVSFMKVYENFHKLEDRSKLKSWICTITINSVRDHIRSKKRKSWLTFFGKDEVQFADYTSANKENMELENVVNLINTKLSIILRETIILYSFEELKISEIADILKVPEGTIKSRISEARKILKCNMEEI